MGITREQAIENVKAEIGKLGVEWDKADANEPHKQGEIASRIARLTEVLELLERLGPKS